MTTFVHVSPHFPESNVYFVEHLASAGVTVLGIGDVWDGQLSGRLRGAMADYYRVESLDDQDNVQILGSPKVETNLIHQQFASCAWSAFVFCILATVSALIACWIPNPVCMMFVLIPLKPVSIPLFMA